MSIATLYPRTSINDNWASIKTVYDGTNTRNYTIHYDAGTATTNDVQWHDMGSSTACNDYYYQSTACNDYYYQPSYSVNIPDGTWEVPDQGLIICGNTFNSQTNTGIEWPTPSESAVKQYKKVQRQIKKAQKKADRLIRGWLSEAEYNYLQEHKELEIPSKLEQETIYIVKRDPFKKVSKKVKGIEKEQLCIVSMNSGFCNDDIFLSKVLLLKTDEERFNTVARKYPVAPLIIG